MAVSPDGNVVVWENCQSGNCDVWKAVKSMAGWTASAITSTGTESRPSTDGQIVAYGSFRSGPLDIFWQPVAGGTERQLTLAGTQRNPNVSGGVITFESRDADLFDLFAYDVAGNTLWRLTNSSTLSEELNDVWVSPTGLVRVVYAVLEDPDDYNVYALSFQRPAAVPPAVLAACTKLAAAVARKVTPPLDATEQAQVRDLCIALALISPRPPLTKAGLCAAIQGSGAYAALPAGGRVKRAIDAACAQEPEDD